MSPCTPEPFVSSCVGGTDLPVGCGGVPDRVRTSKIDPVDSLLPSGSFCPSTDKRPGITYTTGRGRYTFKEEGPRGAGRGVRV